MPMNPIDQGNPLLAAWAGERVPAIDCIAHRGGRMTLMSVHHVETDDGFGTHVRPIADTTIASYLAYGPERWVLIDPNARHESVDGTVIVGGGAWESDGFVAVLDREDVLLWVAFFQSSEPFIRCERAEDRIHAVTIEGTLWSFPIAAPERVTVSAAPDR